MVTITFGNSERRLDEAEPSWIHQQIRVRRDEGQPVCLKVTIITSDLNMVLRTVECGNFGGRGRAPTGAEQQIFELWARFNMNEREFSGGNVIAFLNQIRHLL